MADVPDASGEAALTVRGPGPQIVPCSGACTFRSAIAGLRSCIWPQSSKKYVRLVSLDQYNGQPLLLLREFCHNSRSRGSRWNAAHLHIDLKMRQVRSALPAWWHSSQWCSVGQRHRAAQAGDEQWPCLSLLDDGVGLGAGELNLCVNFDPQLPDEDKMNARYGTPGRVWCSAWHLAG